MAHRIACRPAARRCRRRRGSPAPVSGLLVPAQSSRAANPENSANVYDFLARYYRARFSRLLILLQAAYEPAAILSLGLLVGFVVYSLFVPLVTLLDSVRKLYPETFL